MRRSAFTMSLHEAYGVFAGRSLHDTLGVIERQIGRALPEDFLPRSRDLLFERFRAALQPVAGVKDAIAALPCRRCVASSSAPDRLHLALDVTGLASLFDEHVFSATQVAHGKPAPDLFLLAARTMNAAPAHCIVIEDSDARDRGRPRGRNAGDRLRGREPCDGGPRAAAVRRGRAPGHPFDARITALR